MKNNREIEVGQVRMFHKQCDGTGWEDSMYVIDMIEDSKNTHQNIHLRFITGECSYHTWSESAVQDDIVVM